MLILRHMLFKQYLFVYFFLSPLFYAFLSLYIYVRSISRASKFIYVGGKIQINFVLPKTLNINAAGFLMKFSLKV